MQLNNLKPNTIMIAPSYLHDKIRKTILKDSPGIINVQIQSLVTYLNSEFTDHTTYEYYVILNNLKSQLVHLKNSCDSLSFINELKTLITHMKEYQIPCNRLPENNEVERELKTIIEQLHPVRLSIDEMQANLIAKIPDFNRIVICEGYSSIYEKSIYDLMENHGATRINMRGELKHKQFYYALNKRVEIESLAQYIIEHNIKASDIKISLLDKSYLPYLKMIFDHYQIPLQIQDDQELTFIQNKFIALLNYYLKPSNETSIALLASQTFNTAYIKETIDYLTLYELDLHDTFTIVQNVSISNDVIDQREIERLKTLEVKANEVRSNILPIIEEMQSFKDIIDVLCYIDKLIINEHQFIKNEERKAVLQIREEIKKCDQYLNNKDDLYFFIDIITNLRVQKEGTVEGCAVCDFTHPLPYYPYHFMLGCVQDNYPAMQAFSGIFEESYYDALGYPNLEERYALHLNYFTDNLYTSEHLICFYPISTFDGKANEASLEIEQFMAPLKAEKYPIKANYIPYHRTYSISEQTAKQLYLKDHVLNGSVSSLERYANCPYSYFLRYGLRIEEPTDYSFNNAKAGTLTHFLMETLTNQYGKQYVDAKKDEVYEILHKKVEEMIQLYPNRRQQLSQMKKRLLESIMKNLEVLKDHEDYSSLTPSYSEYKFTHDFKLKDNYQLHLTGFIDRIDMNKDFFRIIDYKSSPKTLKEEYVFAALQLQLITYLVIMEEKLGLRPLGAFYYSFANPNLNMEYAKLKKRPLGFEVYSEDDGFNKLLKEKKLSGWITSEYIEVMDASGSHTKGVRNSKASGINTSTIYQSKTLYEYIQTIYMLLADSILDGNIECKSATGACTYCPYVSICANANHSYAKEELIEVSDKLYIKGGRKNA